MKRDLIALLRREPWVATFLALGTVVFGIVGLMRGQVFLWVYLPALVASVGIVVWLDGNRGPIPGFLLWMLVVWAVAHLAGGLAPDPTGRTEILYGMWIVDGVLRYDQLVHGFGIGAATAVFVVAARSTERPLVWGFAWGQLLGLVNETAENIVAQFVDNSNVGDAVNTAWDMGWRLIGGTVAVFIIGARGLPGRRRAVA